MNIVYCHGVMPPEDDWNNRQYQEKKGWKDWLQFQIEKDKDVIMQIPHFPHAHVNFMKYDEWEKIMDFQDINSDTILIGHSAGGGFILKYLAKHPELKIRQIILVAPWIDVIEYQPYGFYKDFDLNNNIIAQARFGCDLMISDDDSSYILDSFDKIMSKMPDIRVHKFSGRGHFITETLPELLPLIKA